MTHDPLGLEGIAQTSKRASEGSASRVRGSQRRRPPADAVDSVGIRGWFAGLWAGRSDAVDRPHGSLASFGFVSSDANDANDAGPSCWPEAECSPGFVFQDAVTQIT